MEQPRSQGLLSSCPMERVPRNEVVNENQSRLKNNRNVCTLNNARVPLPTSSASKSQLSFLCQCNPVQWISNFFVKDNTLQYDYQRELSLRQKISVHTNTFQRVRLLLASAQRFLNQNALLFKVVQGVLDIKSVTDILVERTFTLPYPCKYASCSEARYFLSDFTNW